MNCLSLNICGVNSIKKRGWVKEVCNENNVMFLGLQETRMTRVELFKIRSLWGNGNFDFACSTARGASGGILSVWDPSIFHKQTMFCTEHMVVVEGTWVVKNLKCCIINVYARQDRHKKRELWGLIRLVLSRSVDKCMIFGDFNAVRNDTERHGTQFCPIIASDFNEFIYEAGLVDIPMGGRRCTRVNSSGAKMSRLDRLLVSENLFDAILEL